MSFNYAIPRSTWKDDSFRGASGEIIPRVKKVRKATRKKTLGQRNRRHIKEITVDGMEHTYHATKGWRARKA